MASLNPLPEDVEIDGETIASQKMEHLQRRFGHMKNGTDKVGKNEQRADSGLGSMSPGPSLESGSFSQEEKLPVQCSDSGDHGNYEPIPRPSAKDSMEELSKEVRNMYLEEDEGIDVLKSVESYNSDVSDSVVEVDLYEQDLDGDTLIHMAIVGGTPMVAEVLIDMAEDIECLNLKNDLFQTPLHLAIITENYDIAIQLVKKGADVKCCDKQGNTPLHLACRKGEKDVIRVLLETLGDSASARQKYFGMKNCGGLTCLHLAAEQKHFLVMGYLFAKGADVNMGDAKSGRTILHYAVEKRDLESVALLLTHPNINVDCKTFKGETPLVLAYWRNYQDIVKKLKSKGAYFSYDLFEESDDDSS